MPGQVSFVVVRVRAGQLESLGFDFEIIINQDVFKAPVITLLNQSKIETIETNDNFEVKIGVVEFQPFFAGFINVSSIAVRLKQISGDHRAIAEDGRIPQGDSLLDYSNVHSKKERIFRLEGIAPSEVGKISFSVSAEDDQGIDYVEFFIDGESAFPALFSPYEYNWDTETAEDDQYHIIGVTAYDITGNTTSATPVAVFVDNFDNEPPAGQIISPYPGQVVSDSVVIEISATDNEGIDLVEISIDGAVVSELSSSPFRYDWDTTLETEDQDHGISALIIDLSNNITYVDPISVFVDNQDPEDTTPPIAVISNPLSGQTVSDIVAFTVMAQDDMGIAAVEFFIDGTSAAVDSTSTYSYDWNTTGLENNSQHTLSAQVTDTSNNTTLAQPILVTVENN